MDSVEECGKPGHRRWRPSSLDLNIHGQIMSVSSLHPLSADDAYTKSSRAISICSRSNLFPSPETPNYWQSGARVSSYRKEWSSERIALSANRGQRYGANALMFPFNNGRTMPSKWEDAEKWICSPVSSDGLRRPLILPSCQRRPKSKSGPLGTTALTGGACSSALLQFSCYENGRVASIKADGQAPPGNYIRSKDDRVNSIKEPATMLSHTTMRRDVGTQMSPEESIHSSPKEGPSPCLSPSASSTTTDLESHFSCLEISNVQVDDRGRVVKRSKKHISWCSDKSSTDIIEWKKKMVESPASDFEVVVTEGHMSEYAREEAKLMACENPLKEKVESAVSEVEKKFEKRGSSSTCKILKRVKSVQKKADDMQISVAERQARLVSRTSQRFPYFGKYVLVSSLCACFTGHDF